MDIKSRSEGIFLGAWRFSHLNCCCWDHLLVNSLHLYLIRKSQKDPKIWETWATKYKFFLHEAKCIQSLPFAWAVLCTKSNTKFVHRRKNTLNVPSEAKNSESTGSAKFVVVMELNRQNILSWKLKFIQRLTFLWVNFSTNSNVKFVRVSVCPHPPLWVLNYSHISKNASNLSEDLTNSTN